jgi:uncharacterized protein (DUF362 family)
MLRINRRDLLLTAGAGALLGTASAAASKTRVAIVASNHKKLPRPASLDDPLDYERVRGMVWKAIGYAKPRAGSLEAKIRRGSWVVVKPNMGLLRPQPGYTPGDITDLRVTRAVLEYLARYSHAARITVAEGGSYRAVNDPGANDVVRQNGERVDGLTFDWGGKEFPGTGGSLGAMIEEFGRRFPDRKFDYVNLNYDGVRDASGAYTRIEVPRAKNGVGGFGARTDYCITNTIRNCDFLISVPVMKVHLQCGITACLKNYVGTAPREFYAGPRAYSNSKLHAEHSLEGRIDSFIADLSAFHPPDYCVVDAIRGLQHAEHNRNLPDQMIRSNMVVAGEDAVATDAVLAYLMGFNPWDIEFLHMAASRETGTNDMARIDVIGDEADRLRRTWAKPRNWYGRCNREWLLTRDPEANLAAWQRHTARTDTVDFVKALGAAPAYAAAVRVRADGARKAFLWVGARGRVVASLNGQQVLAEENSTRYRIGQFRAPVELRSGENLLAFRVEALGEQAQLSALLVGARNDGDTVEGIRWLV